MSLAFPDDSSQVSQTSVVSQHAQQVLNGGGTSGQGVFEQQYVQTQQPQINSTQQSYVGGRGDAGVESGADIDGGAWYKPWTWGSSSQPEQRTRPNSQPRIAQTYDASIPKRPLTNEEDDESTEYESIVDDNGVEMNQNYSTQQQKPHWGFAPEAAPAHALNPVSRQADYAYKSTNTSAGQPTNYPSASLLPPTNQMPNAAHLNSYNQQQPHQTNAQQNKNENLVNLVRQHQRQERLEEDRRNQMQQQQLENVSNNQHNQQVQEHRQIQQVLQRQVAMEEAQNQRQRQQQQRTQQAALQQQLQPLEFNNVPQADNENAGLRSQQRDLTNETNFPGASQHVQQLDSLECSDASASCTDSVGNEDDKQNCASGSSASCTGASTLSTSSSSYSSSSSDSFSSSSSDSFSSSYSDTSSSSTSSPSSLYKRVRSNVEAVRAAFEKEDQLEREALSAAGIKTQRNNVVQSQRLVGNRRRDLGCDEQLGSLSTSSGSNAYFTDVCCDDDDKPSCNTLYNDEDRCDGDDDQRDPFANFDFDCTSPPSNDCKPFNDCRPLNNTRAIDPYCTEAVCDPNCRPLSARPRRPQTPRYQRPQYERPQYKRPSPCTVPRNTCDTDTTAALDQVIRLAEQKINEAERATEAAKRAEKQRLERQQQLLARSIAALEAKKTKVVEQTQKVDAQLTQAKAKLVTANSLKSKTSNHTATSYIDNAVAVCEAAVNQHNDLKAKLETIKNRIDQQISNQQDEKTKVDTEIPKVDTESTALVAGDLYEYESDNNYNDNDEDDSSVQGGRVAVYQDKELEQLDA